MTDTFDTSTYEGRIALEIHRLLKQSQEVRDLVYGWNAQLAQIEEQLKVLERIASPEPAPQGDPFPESNF